MSNTIKQILLSLVFMFSVITAHAQIGGVITSLDVSDDTTTVFGPTAIGFVGATVTEPIPGLALITITGATGYSIIEEEGSGLTQRNTLNFVGAGSTCIDSGGKTQCTITSGVTPSGSNNQVITDDGASGIVSEANLTFDGSILTITGTTLFAGILQDNDDMVFEVDADDNGSNSFIWTDGAATQIATLSEAGAYQIANDMIVSGGDITFGSITARIGDVATVSLALIADEIDFEPAGIPVRKITPGGNTSTVTEHVATGDTQGGIKLGTQVTDNPCPVRGAGFFYFTTGSLLCICPDSVEGILVDGGTTCTY